MPFKKFFTFLISTGLLVSCASNQKLSKDESKAELYYSQGTSKLISKDYTEALKMLLEANRLDPNNSKTLNNLGMTYYYKGEVELAKKSILESLNTDSTNSDARNNLASIYFHQRDYKKAKEQYLIVSKDLLYTAQFKTWYNMALIDLAMGNEEQGIAKLKRSVSIKSDYCAANYKIGVIYKKKYQYSKALSYFKDASKFNCHGLPAPHYQQALLHLDLKQYDQANYKFKDIIERFDGTAYASKSLTKMTGLSRMRDSFSSEINASKSLKTQKKDKIKRYKSNSF